MDCLVYVEELQGSLRPRRSEKNKRARLMLTQIEIIEDFSLKEMSAYQIRYSIISDIWGEAVE